jgi:hypothetical protein
MVVSSCAGTNLSGLRASASMIEAMKIRGVKGAGGGLSDDAV